MTNTTNSLFNNSASDYMDFLVIWFILMVTGILANIIVLIKILRSKTFECVTQYYMINLAITDMAFVIFCIPITIISYLTDEWFMGRYACKASHFMTFSTVIGNCLTLTMMTVDRYIFICSNYQWRKPRYVLYVTILIWITSFVLSIPMIIHYDTVLLDYKIFNGSVVLSEKITECVQVTSTFWVEFSHWYSTLLSYILPSIVLIYCYFKIVSHLSKNEKRMKASSKYTNHKKQKVARTVIVLIFTFIILWLPVNVISTWYKLDPNFPKKRIFFILKIVGHTMSYANPTINPIIYGTDLSCLKKLCISQKALNHQKTMSTNRQRNIEHYTMSTYSKIKSKV